MITRKTRLHKCLVITVLIALIFGGSMILAYGQLTTETTRSTKRDGGEGLFGDTNDNTRPIVNPSDNNLLPSKKQKDLLDLWSDQKKTSSTTNVSDKARGDISGKELLDLFYLLPLLEKVKEYGSVTITIIGDNPSLFNSSVHLIKTFTENSSVKTFSRTDLFLSLLFLILGTNAIENFGFTLQLINVGDLPLFSEEILLSALEYAITTQGEIIISIFSPMTRLPGDMIQLLDSTDKLLLLPEPWPNPILGKSTTRHAWNILRIGGIPYPSAISADYATVGLTSTLPSIFSGHGSFAPDIVAPDVVPQDLFGNKESIASRENSTEALDFLGNSTMSGSLIPTIYVGIGLGLVVSILSAQKKPVSMAKLRLAVINSSLPTYLKHPEFGLVKIGYGIPDFWGTLQVYSQSTAITTSRLGFIQGSWNNIQDNSKNNRPTIEIPVGKWNNIFLWVDVWEDSSPVIPYNTETRAISLSSTQSINFKIGSNSGIFLFNISVLSDILPKNSKIPENVTLSINIIRKNEVLISTFLQLEITVPKAFGAFIHNSSAISYSPLLDFNEFRLSLIYQKVWVEDLSLQNLTLQELLPYDFLIMTNESLTALYQDIHAFVNLGGKVLVIPPEDIHARKTWFQELNTTYLLQNVEYTSRNEWYKEQNVSLPSLYFPLSKFNYPNDITMIRARIHPPMSLMEENDTETQSNPSDQLLFFAENMLFQDKEIDLQGGLDNYSLVDVYLRHKIYSLVLAKKINLGAIVILSSPLLLTSIIAQWYGALESYRHLWTYLSSFLSSPNWQPRVSVIKSIKEVSISLKIPSAWNWGVLGMSKEDIERSVEITYLKDPLESAKKPKYQIDWKKDKLIIKIPHILGDKFNLEFLLKIPGLTTKQFELTIDHTVQSYGRENWKLSLLVIVFSSMLLVGIIYTIKGRGKQLVKRVSILHGLSRRQLCPNCRLDTFSEKAQQCSWCDYKNESVRVIRED